jgi:MFS transporter, ACS family, hexuronate transporter
LFIEVEDLKQFRWVICVLLLLGMTKNYMDRQVIGILKTTLQHQFAWSEIDYGNLVAAFQAAYALGLLFVGRFIDQLGTRIGYASAMAVWSLASVTQGWMSSLSGFLAGRSALGLGESAVFPASVKCIAEWFPRRERALALGVANAGTNLGAIITPLLVPWITWHWGWRWAFFSIGSAGFLWLALWLWLYRSPEEHPLCAPAELAHIRSDPVEPETRLHWLSLLPHKQTWAFALAKFTTDPIWWFLLFWVPDFLQREHGLSLLQIGPPIVVIYLMADGGSIAGGWFSSFLIHRGRSVNFSRKIAMLICAISIVPVVFAPKMNSTAGAVLLLGLAAAAHQGFSANLYTIASDMFPRKAVASIVGFGGMAGAVGGLLIAKIVSYFLEWTGSYSLPFFIAGSAYLVALGMVQILAPGLQPAKLESGDSRSAI